MKARWWTPIFLMLTVGAMFAAVSPLTNGQEFPHVAASKIVSPTRAEEGATIQVTINLSGAGGMLLTPVDVILTIDKSGSMAGKKIKDAKEAAKTFLGYTDEKDRVGLVTFSTTVATPSPLNLMTPTNKESLKSKIDSIVAAGSTDMYDAIVTANNMLLEAPRTNAPRVQILLTDGIHNWPSELSDSAFVELASQAKDNDIIIYTIGLGSDVNANRLQIIAHTTGGTYYFAATSDELQGVYQEIGSKLAFAGTNIKVTETVPSYLTYNGDASQELSMTTSEDGIALEWRIGHLKIGEEWQVSYTAQAEKAVEAVSTVVQAKVEYMTSEAASAVLNLTPGIVFHDVAVTQLGVASASIGRGNLASFNVTIENRGNIRDSFELRVSFDESFLDSRTVTLEAGETSLISISWNTSDAEAGKYDVTAEADPEQNIWDADRTNNKAKTNVEIIGTGGSFILVVIFAIVMTIAVGGVAYVKPRIQATGYICPADHAPLKYSRTTRQWYCPRCRRLYKIK